MLYLKELRKEKGLTLDELASKSGVSKRMLSAYEAGTNDITLNKLQDIATSLGTSVANLVGEKSTNEVSDHYIPLYDDLVMAGSKDVANMSSNIDQFELINTGDWFTDATAAIRVHGDSMHPEYEPGSIVAVKEVNNKRLIIPGQDYVVETSEYRVIKRLQKNNDSKSWLACSVNTEIWEHGLMKGSLIHEPFVIHTDDISRLFIVLGSVKRKQSVLIQYKNNRK